MRVNLPPAWRNKVLDEIYREDFVVRTEYVAAAQWVVLRLLERKLPYRIINLGAGIKEITTKVDTCPKCHGTGKV